MNADRPSHDDELAAELAALDEVLRKTVESERRPLAPTDFKVTEPLELVGPQQDRVKPSVEREGALLDPAVPSHDPAVPSHDRAGRSRERVAAPSHNRSVPTPDHIAPPRH